MISFIFGGYRLVAVFKEVRIGDGESENFLKIAIHDNEIGKAKIGKYCTSIPKVDFRK
jgi:hypothetical protein